jgi:hypothetical protein
MIFNYYETKLQIKVVNKLKRNSLINIKIPYAAKYDIQYCGYNAWHYPVHRSLFDAHFFSNKSPTRCNNFPVYYPDVYLQLNMFWVFSRPSSRAQ